MFSCLKYVVIFISNFRFVSFALFELVIVFNSSFSYAQIYKCIDATGRTAIGDQPCMTRSAEQIESIGKSKTPLATAVATLASGKLEKERTSSMLAALEERIQLAHNPECRELRNQLKRRGYINDGLLTIHQPLLADSKWLWERYQPRCLLQANDVIVLDGAQKEGAKREMARKSECEAKTREYGKRKQRATNLSELEAYAFAVLESEVARGCR